jgi:hypothetical protein
VCFNYVTKQWNTEACRVDSVDLVVLCTTWALMVTGGKTRNCIWAEQIFLRGYPSTSRDCPENRRPGRAERYWIRTNRAYRSEREPAF